MERRRTDHVLVALAAATLLAGSLGVTGYVLRDRIAEIQAWRRLLSRIGTDLRSRDPAESQRLTREMRLLAPPNVERDRPIPTAPRFVFKMKASAGADRIVILEEALLSSSHRECAVYVHVFDSDRRRLCSSRINAGWRTDVRQVTVVSPPELDGDALLVETWDQQYYALVDDRPVLVRLTGKDQSYRNHYHHPNIAVGAPVPLRPADEHEKCLFSADAKAQLQLLVWLGGYHMDPRIPPPENLYHEDDRLAALAFELQSRPSVRKRLVELSDSSNRWLADAARLASDPQWQQP